MCEVPFIYYCTCSGYEVQCTLTSGTRAITLLQGSNMEGIILCIQVSITPFCWHELLVVHFATHFLAVLVA